MWLRSPRGLGRDRSGIVAVEFALIAPLLLVLVLGTFEVSSLVRVSLKLSHAANNLAKIVAQQPPASDGTPTALTQAQVADFCTGASYVLNPYPSTSLSAAVVSLTSATGGAPKTDWEADKACPATASSYAAAAVTLATGASSGYALTPNANDRVIVVRASLTYTPVLHYVLGSSWTLTQTAFARTRNSSGVTCTGCS